jgi:hypothetical protein
MEAIICELRQHLAQNSDLGFIGPQAIADALTLRCSPEELPSVRTIARVLARHGLLDASRRVRRKAPPTGWHLPAVRFGAASLDAFDIIEDLVIEGAGRCHALTTKSLGTPWVNAWLHERITTAWIIQRLRSHWQRHGRPVYAQFDNDTRFQGPHCRPNVIGELIRYCLRLGITPVFAPPRETGFQADIEGFNALWQAKVWKRAHHTSLPALQQLSDTFCAAYTTHRAARGEHSAPRRPYPVQEPTNAITSGAIIYIRRTDEHGRVRLLGHSYAVDSAWPHRLVRAELDVRTLALRFHRLRRRAPDEQDLILQTQLQGSLRLG